MLFYKDQLGIQVGGDSEKTTKIIRFQKVPNQTISTEAYEVKADPVANTVLIRASNNAGAFYGAQTLLSLIANDNKEIPKVDIYDEPR